MSRLRCLHNRAMGRNPQALLLSCKAFEPMQGENARRAIMIQSSEDSEARFDVEGAICWRDPQAERPGRAC